MSLEKVRPSKATSLTLVFPPLNKAPLYLVCVPNKVKGESSDVNIHFLLCVTKEVIRRTSKGKTCQQGLEPAETESNGESRAAVY